MDIADRINNKEVELEWKKNYYASFLENGQIKLAKEMKESIIDLKASIEHDREIQKIEAATSGRKEWWHNPVKYGLIYFGGAASIVILEFILDKL